MKELIIPIWIGKHTEITFLKFPIRPYSFCIVAWLLDLSTGWIFQSVKKSLLYYDYIILSLGWYFAVCVTKDISIESKKYENDTFDKAISQWLEYKYHRWTLVADSSWVCTHMSPIFDGSPFFLGPSWTRITLVGGLYLDNLPRGAKPSYLPQAQLLDLCILAPEGRIGFSHTAKELQWPHIYTIYEATYGLLCLFLKIFVKNWFFQFGTTPIFDEF